MTKDDILNLGALARIRMSHDEAAALNTEITAILEYVSQVTDVVGDAALTKNVGPVHNVFRVDETTNEPEQYTEALLAAMPERSGRFMRVKKILHTED